MEAGLIHLIRCPTKLDLAVIIFIVTLLSAPHKSTPDPRN